MVRTSFLSRLAAIGVAILAVMPRVASGQASEHAFVLVPGAAKGSLAARMAYQPMLTLADRLREAGAANVMFVETTNDLRMPKAIAEREVEAAMQHLLRTGVKRVTVIAHSMGHATALKALLANDLWRHVDVVIGLAGAARGGDRPPQGCEQVGRRTPSERCPGIVGLLMNEPDYEMTRFYRDHAAALAELDKCSLAVVDDRLLSPSNSGFLPGGANFYVDFAGHIDLPTAPELLSFLEHHCGLRVADEV